MWCWLYNEGENFELVAVAEVFVFCVVIELEDDIGLCDDGNGEILLLVDGCKFFCGSCECLGGSMRLVRVAEE